MTSDKVLIEARDFSIRMEQAAVSDLEKNIDGYLQPSWSARKLLEGYKHYVKTSENTPDYYENLRIAFSDTKGKSHKVFADVLKTHTPAKEYDYNKSIFEFDDAEAIIKTGLYHLKHHGFYKCKFRVPDNIVKSLRDKTNRGLDIQHETGIVDKMMVGDKNSPLQIKIDSRVFSTFEEVYQISGDPILLGIVQAYMGVPPIFNTPVAMLNSFAKIKKERDLSDTAQMYHHDMHRLQWVKLFVYLTDVDMNSGPHTLIKGTHRERPDHLWKDGRHTDKKIAEAGILSNEERIVGKAGTIILVDTSCLHKGSHPETTSRLMASIQYSNSLYGKPLAKSDHKIEMSLEGTKNANILQAAELVRKYANISGVRFMQNYI